MIEIKPQIDHRPGCPYCHHAITIDGILWQGIHICSTGRCDLCRTRIVSDLEVGHALFYPYQVDLEKGRYFGIGSAEDWFGEPLLHSLLNPMVEEKVTLKVEKFKDVRKAVIINCIDYLYGHSLLKLLNAQPHLNSGEGFGLITIVQKFLRWMVPAGVAEIWTVDIPLSRARNYYPHLNELIQREIDRFDSVHLSPTEPHPGCSDISRYTGISKHDGKGGDFRITFIWREDRFWYENNRVHRFAMKNRLQYLIGRWQAFKIEQLFKLLKQRFPRTRFTVAGLGNGSSLPGWIDDRRLQKFDESSEKDLCRIYSESRVVIGVHGSNMLLPSAHAGMTVDLMPQDRWGNFAQDILFHENDPKMASFTYRFLPLKIDVEELAHIITTMIADYDHFRTQMSSSP